MSNTKKAMKNIISTYKAYKNVDFLNLEMTKPATKALNMIKKNPDLRKALIKDKKVPMVFGLLRIAAGIGQKQKQCFFPHAKMYEYKEMDLKLILDILEEDYTVYPIYGEDNILDPFVVYSVIYRMSKFFKSITWVKEMTGFSAYMNKFLAGKPSIYNRLSYVIMSKGRTWNLTSTSMCVRFAEDSEKNLKDIYIIDDHLKQGIIEIIEALKAEDYYNKIKQKYDKNKVLP